MRKPPALALAAGLAMLMTTSLLSPAHAEIWPEAQAIVDRWVEASGGRAALDAEQSLRIKGRLNALHDRGRFEQWSQVPDRYSSKVTIGPIQLREGFDGEVGWRTDLDSRQVTPAEGKDLDRLRAEAYFDNEMWARSGQGGGKVALGTTSFLKGERYASLDVTPPAGPARRLWFSSKTGLLTRITMRHDRSSSDLWLEEYRKLAHRQRATVLASEGSDVRITWDPHEDPEGDRYLVDSVWANPPSIASRFTPPASRVPAPTFLGAAGRARVPFRYGGHAVWVRVSINGNEPADFLLDTGASMTFLDRDYAEQIGMTAKGEIGVQGMGGSAAASFSRASTIDLRGLGADGLRVRDLKVGLLDFGYGYEYVMWRKMAGIIGADILSRCVVDLDYDAGVVTFLDPKSFTPPESAHPIDIGLMNGIPTVRAEIDSGCGGRFLIDVGNSLCLTLHGSLVRECGLVNSTQGRKQVEIQGGGVGAGFVSWLARFQRFRIGDFTITQPIAGLSLRTQGMVGSNEIAGNIGNSVLERFRVTIDYSRRKLYLRPGRRFDQADRYSRVGMMLIRFKTRVVAAHVVHGSAASDAGFTADDEVTAIDGRSALAFTPEEMDRLFVDGELGSSHTFLVMRDGRPKKLTLKLRDVL